MWTRPLASADASCGGKAHGMARLIAAGLRVPPGFVLDDRAFRIAIGDAAIGEPATLGHALDELAQRVATLELPAALVDEVVARARELGGPFAVRSSATIEDTAAGAAAGVFSSRTAVPEAELWTAIRAVWVSALTPLAATYARRRGGEIAIAVIVQRFVEGEPITVYTRPPGAPTTDELWWQQAGVVSKLPRRAGELLDAEVAIGAARGADLELIVPRDRPDELWFVQARPIVHPVIARRSPPPPLVLAPLHDGRRWTLDLAHNPDPLSVAQADLVARVEQAGAAPWSSRVCAGYLYTTPTSRPEVEPPATAAELADRLREIEARLFPLGPPEDEVTLAQALERYLAFFRVWAFELGPLIARSRARLPVPAERASAVEALLVEVARGSEVHRGLLGVLAPAWDVAVPTFAERPGLLEDAIARTRQVLRERPASPPNAAITEDYTFAAVVAEYAERDDHHFARAQWMVRRTILARADALGIAREDACWIAIDDLLRDEFDPVQARRLASGARTAAARAATWSMPIVVGDSSTGDRGVALHGIGSGHQLTGRVRRFESLASAIVVGHGDIVVTRAVTPALAVIVIGCAAIISETGGLLDHGAAMARELGIPCIVGCRDAWSQLADGMIVSIENDHVTITR